MTFAIDFDGTLVSNAYPNIGVPKLDMIEKAKKLQAEGMTLVIVSHEMAFIKELNPRIVYLEDGKIKKIGTYKDCLKDKENESLQLFLSKID